MGTIGQGEFRSKLASADLSDYQYRFVKLSTTDDTVTYNDSSATRPYGVLQNAPESGEVAVVRVSGESLLDSTATSGFAANALVMSDSAGKGIASASAGYVAGIVVTPAVASLYDNLITVKLVDSPAVTA